MTDQTMTTATPAPTALDLLAHIQQQMTTIAAQDLWANALALECTLASVDDERALDSVNDGMLPVVREDIPHGYAEKTPLQVLGLLSHLDALARNPELAVKLLQRVNARMHATFLPAATCSTEAAPSSTPPPAIPPLATTVPAFVDLVTILTERAARLPLSEALNGGESLILAMQHAYLHKQVDAQFPSISEMTFSLGQSDQPGLRALGTLLDVYSIHAAGVGGAVAAGVYADLCKALQAPTD